MTDERLVIAICLALLILLNPAIGAIATFFLHPPVVELYRDLREARS